MVAEPQHLKLQDCNLVVAEPKLLKLLDCVLSGIAGFYGVYSVYNVNFEIGKLEDPSKFIDYASCGDDQ